MEEVIIQPKGKEAIPPAEMVPDDQEGFIGQLRNRRMDHHPGEMSFNPKVNIISKKIDEEKDMAGGDHQAIHFSMSATPFKIRKKIMKARNRMGATRLLILILRSGYRAARATDTMNQVM